jgi:hypothetical protein
VDAATATQFLDVFGVDDLEFEPEFFEHLDTPLFLERGRTGDEYRTRAVAQQHLLNDEPGFDRFAEPDVVGDQQIGACHLDRAHQWVQLKILDTHSTAKGRLQKPFVRVRRRAPAYSVQERFKRLCVIASRYARQTGFFDDVSARLDLPDDFDLLAQAVFIYR